MTALYFAVLRPQDRVAVKPHASPVFHAIQYLLGKQSRERLEAFRGYKGAQSYPSRTKDADDVDFSTGSVGLGVAQTLFSSLTQDYVRAHGWASIGPKDVWWRWSAMPSSTKAIFSRRCSKAGNRGSVIAGGLSTTTGRASTPSFAKGCGSATSSFSRISAGTL